MLAACVNVPALTKSSDSRLALDYCATNNGYVRAIALGANGWDSAICPSSMQRAFHGASSLRAIIGILDLQRMTAALGDNTFLNCRNLDHFQIRNVPDAITQINLSECGDIFAPNYYQGGTPLQTGARLSSLEYLHAHYNDSVSRKKVLTVIVAESQVDKWSNSNPYLQFAYWEAETPSFVVSVLEGK